MSTKLTKTDFFTSLRNSQLFSIEETILIQNLISALDISSAIREFGAQTPGKAQHAELLLRLHTSGFLLEHQVGAGGMGIVFSARSERHGSGSLAIKTMHYEKIAQQRLCSQLPELLKRFSREMVVAKAVGHPNIVPIIETYPDSSYPFYCMPLIQGRSILQVVQQDGPLPPGTARRYLRDVLEGLVEIHANDYIHRDVTAGNVLIDETIDVAKLTDFGTARTNLAAAVTPYAETILRISSTGRVIGTRAYMAPESFHSPDKVCSASDVYALGCLWYFMLTGTPPFDGVRADIAVQHTQVPFPDPRHSTSISNDDANLLMQMVSKRTVDRPTDATAVLALLDGACEIHRPAWLEMTTGSASGSDDGNVAVEVPPGSEFTADPSSLIPNFLLFDCNGIRSLVVVDSKCTVDATRIQKSQYPRRKSVLLSTEEIRRIGFDVGRVHPLFHSGSCMVDQVVVDANILALLACFPRTTVRVPIYIANSTTYTTFSISRFITMLLRLHGDKMFFCALSQGNHWRHSLFADRLASRPVSTRFAPTPSNQLHLGSLRTALISFIASKVNAGGAFSLRYDDTDRERCRKGSEAEIERDLNAIGIVWSDEHTFRQSDPESLDRYDRVKRVLREDGLLSHSNRSEVLSIDNSSHHSESYSSLTIDLRMGPQVCHQQPTDRRGARKEIAVCRSEDGGLPYYRFAGAIDDSQMFNVVFRDFRQVGLTVVQSHVLNVLEVARRDSSKKTDTSSALTYSGFDPLVPIPHPAYSHVALVVDDEGNSLSKRESRGEWTLQFLRRELGIRPEAILAYLASTMATMLGETDNPSSLVRRFAAAVSDFGKHSFIEELAKRVSVLNLVEKPIRITANMHLIRLANRVLLCAMSSWQLQNWIEQEGMDVGRIFLGQLLKHVHYFDNWNEICALINGPDAKESHRYDDTMQRCHRDGGQQHTQDGDGSDALQVVQTLRDLCDQSSPGTRQRCFGDLRETLMGAREGPPVSVILDVLRPEFVAQRISRRLDLDRVKSMLGSHIGGEW